MTTPLPPVHPGQVLREEFLVPYGMSAAALARATQLPRTRIERLVREEVDLTPDTALLLARYFGTSPAFWMNLQGGYALDKARDQLSNMLEQILPMAKAAEGRP